MGGGKIKACIITPGIKCILKKLPGLEHSLVVECLCSVHEVLNGILSLGPRAHVERPEPIIRNSGWSV